ncbi:MAG: FAD-dependent oxidoreductase [Archangium sp.]
MSPETFQATLVSARSVTPRVRELVFERDGAPFHFKSGQWVSVVLPQPDEKGRPVRRSYSIASVPAPGSSRFELVVTKVDGGVGSTWLHELMVGAKVEVKGPQGMFLRPLDVGPSLFVATGTGVAPFRGMLHDALAAGRTEPLWVLFGVRTPADAMYREEFEALARQHSNVKFLLTLSRPTSEWKGLSGYVQTHTLSLWNELKALGPATPHAYICGVKKMLLEVRDVLKTHGAERQQLHLESYD